MQHLFTPFRAGVEHHALAEDRRHERVCLGLVQVVVARPEEEFVGVRAGQQHDLLPGQLEGTDVSAFVADPLHQPDRIGAELLEVAVFVVATRNPG
ncbi:Uncharacterised protein [Mycobacterium tuberculosis]|nr:Uncharacterised protein [Mycobacterium tuberculosis]COW11563.1 Uncharacterised protein [Mycobacterium tuberculosis]